MNTINNHNFEQNALSFLKIYLLNNYVWHYIFWTNFFNGNDLCSISCSSNWNPQFLKKYVISKWDFEKETRVTKVSIMVKKKRCNFLLQWHYREKWVTLLVKNKIYFKMQVNYWIDTIKYQVFLWKFLLYVVEDLKNHSLILKN